MPAANDSRSAMELELAEAHHRISNSLTVIASMVRLQAADVAARQDQISANEVRLVLDDVAARIGTVAQLHRLMSKAPRRNAVDLVDYLREICGNLATALSMNGELKVTGPAGSCLVPPDQAVSLALVASELVTNAIKHCHPSGVAGRIEVHCDRDQDGALVLEVGDDGVGLPDGFDPAVDGGLGFRLVHSLVDQLCASVAFHDTGLGLVVRLKLTGVH